MVWRKNIPQHTNAGHNNRDTIVHTPEPFPVSACSDPAAFTANRKEQYEGGLMAYLVLNNSVLREP
jgi:hypothetical protein